MDTTRNSINPKSKSIKSTSETLIAAPGRDNISTRRNSLLEEETLQDEIEFNDFEQAIPAMCIKFECPVTVIVEKSSQDNSYLNYMKVTSKGKEKNEMARSTATRHSETPSASIADLCVYTDLCADSLGCLVIQTVYDRDANLVEVAFKNLKKMELITLQVIGLVAPLYKELDKITFINVGINAYIMAELRSFIPSTTIKEIYLEGLYYKEANYSVFLDPPMRLHRLVIKRCKINDEVCKQIASKLTFDKEAGKTLKTLNLAFNQITDTGTKYLVDAMRTNRCLRYINLAGNQLSDEGAFHILNVLQEFRLTIVEIEDNRRLRFEYLKKRENVLQHLQVMKVEHKVERTQKTFQGKKLSVDERIDKFVDEEVGPFPEHFAGANVKTVDGVPCCIGNFVLCYLNIAFNNLTIFTLQKIEEVLKYQSAVVGKNSTGLMYVMFDGNNLPSNCEELTKIYNYLENNLIRMVSGIRDQGHAESRKKTAERSKK